MSWPDFLSIYVPILVAILLCRVVPLFALRGRALPERAERAIGLIPPAAFAALVTNDLLQPATLATDPLGGLLPLVSAAVVAVVARRTKSLIWCALVGMGVYALLLMAFGRLG